MRAVVARYRWCQRTRTFGVGARTRGSVGSRRPFAAGWAASRHATGHKSSRRHLRIAMRRQHGIDWLPLVRATTVGALNQHVRGFEIVEVPGMDPGPERVPRTSGRRSGPQPSNGPSVDPSNNNRLKGAPRAVAPGVPDGWIRHADRHRLRTMDASGSSPVPSGVPAYRGSRYGTSATIVFGRAKRRSLRRKAVWLWSRRSHQWRGTNSERTTRIGRAGSWRWSTSR